jgi:hypothetical protein
VQQDLRIKLGLLVIEHESDSVGVARIAQDQARRTEIRLAAQKRLTPKPKKEPKPKPVKIPKVKREAKPRKKRAVVKEQVDHSLSTKEGV